MQDKSSRRREFYAGGLMALIGLGTVLEAWTYDVGSLTEMGPGFLPLILGIVLIFISVLIALGAGQAGDAAGALAEPAHMAIGQFDWRGGIAIIIGVMAFIVFGALAGLIPATFACVFISALGDRTSTPRSAALLALCVTVLGCGLFSFVLKVPFPLIRW
jgi:hypothetical protein